MAVVYARGCSSDLTQSLGTSICHGYGPKKTINQLNTIISQGVPVVARRLRIQTGIHEDEGLILALFSGLKDKALP